MRRMISFTTAMLFVAAHVCVAQGVLATVGAAEAEGSAFPRLDQPSALASFFARPFGGTTERQCVAASDGSMRDGSLRSGDMIIRGVFSGPWGLRANRDSKFLWVPLHLPTEDRDTLLIRAARVDRPADSLRQAVAHWAWSRSKTESGFPSLVRFPAAGEWLVVATAGHDWGCFVMTVAD